VSDILKVSLIQTSLFWEDPLKNHVHLSKKIKSIDQQTDLIILPEMFPTGFSMNAAPLAEEPKGASLRWMQEMANTYETAISGSVIVKENDLFYNRLYFVFPNGTFETYDKRHTFTYAGEDKVYAAGKERLVVNYKGWKIRPLICYDLRFPVWARNDQDYDMIFYIASWPKSRMRAWDTLLRARAIENMAYCIGVNRTGMDGNQHEYVGHSAVYDTLGEQVSSLDFEEDFVQTIVLSKEHIQLNRNRFHFLDDRDSFEIKN